MYTYYLYSVLIVILISTYRHIYHLYFSLLLCIYAFKKLLLYLFSGVLEENTQKSKDHVKYIPSLSLPKCQSKTLF